MKYRRYPVKPNDGREYTYNALFDYWEESDQYFEITRGNRKCHINPDAKVIQADKDIPGRKGNETLHQTSNQRQRVHT